MPESFRARSRSFCVRLESVRASLAVFACGLPEGGVAEFLRVWQRADILAIPLFLRRTPQASEAEPECEGAGCEAAEDCWWSAGRPSAARGRAARPAA